MQALQALRARLIDATIGSLARDDGRDMTQWLDERRAEAKDKGW